MSNFLNWAKQYNHMWVAIVGAILTTVTLLFPNNQWVTIIVAFATALGIRLTNNVPSTVTPPEQG